MTGAASLAQLLSTRADINYYTSQQIYWSNLYESNTEKLTRYTKYEEDWVDAYDAAMSEDRSRDLKAGNVTIGKDDCVTTQKAEEYAYAKVAHRNAELLAELEEQDIEYEMMKTMYEESLSMLRAREESEEQLVNKNVTETYLLGGG